MVRFLPLDKACHCRIKNHVHNAHAQLAQLKLLVMSKMSSSSVLRFKGFATNICFIFCSSRNNASVHVAEGFAIYCQFFFQGLATHQREQISPQITHN